MHGIVLKGLKDFVVESYGQDAWHNIQDRAGVGRRIYVPVTEYPDEEVLGLVAAACEETGEEAPAVLEAFGEFLVAPLVSTYGVHVDGEWSGLELLANVETYIHEALRAKQLSEFTPPNLDARQVDEDRVLLEYGSDRQLCALARGIFQGVADHYGERFEVTEHQCMKAGADHCEFEIERIDHGEGNEEVTP